MSTKAHAGTFGKRFNNSSEGASSCAWPGTRAKSISARPRRRHRQSCCRSRLSNGPTPRYCRWCCD
jgi:hypothetical protein